MKHRTKRGLYEDIKNSEIDAQNATIFQRGFRTNYLFPRITSTQNGREKFIDVIIDWVENSSRFEKNQLYYEKARNI